MGLKYVLNSMKRRKLRTLIVALALIVGVALVGALLALVDTQRQFSVQTVGTQTGGYDLSIKRSDLADTPFFDLAAVSQAARQAYPPISSVYPRIQGNAEARKVNATEGSSVTLVALDVEKDQLSPPTPVLGTYPPLPGQIYLTQDVADGMQIGVGDELTLAYLRPIPRQEGKAASSGNSSAREEATFVVSGIGQINLGNDVSAAAVIRLEDAQRWLNAADKANRLLLVWESDTAAGQDAQAAVTRARAVAEQVKDTLQTALGPDFEIGLAKYVQLQATAQAFIFQQTFITLYGLLSMGIVGLMVNALMMTTVAEQKHDLAVLRVLGAPRARLFEAVILEVFLLGTIGIIFGILLGRVINDYAITPLLLSNLKLPDSVRPDWTLRSVVTPTLITASVLALATITPARTAASTKVMVVLNPAAADQPTLEDLSKLRERRANYGLLVTGVILLAFCSVILIVFPLVFGSGDQNGLATMIFSAFLLMVVGMSLVFYFFTTPIERILIGLYQLVNKKAAFFASRYALRGKGRNAIISLMVVMSAVLPTLLATQLALSDANIDTDLRFQRGTDIYARPVVIFGGGGGGGGPIFRRAVRTDSRMSNDDITNLARQGGIANVAGLGEDYRSEASDRVQLRSSSVEFVGVQGDLSQVLYPGFYRWTQGDTAALTRITQDPDAVIISQGLSEVLDLKLGDTLRLKGEGLDHERLVKIVGVAARIPGFSNGITRNRNDAGNSVILMNIETYRELRHDPDKGALDPDEKLVSRMLARAEPGVDQTVLARQLRDFFDRGEGISLELTTELIERIREQLTQGRIFIVVLTGLSMVTAIFGVLAVMYTAVMGRRVEIGMLKAVGAAKGALRGIFIGEAIITTLAAALAGIVAGTTLGYAFEGTQRLQEDTPMLLAFDSVTSGVIVVMVCFAAIFSAALATQPVIRQKAIKILRER